MYTQGLDAQYAEIGGAADAAALEARFQARIDTEGTIEPKDRMHTRYGVSRDQMIAQAYGLDREAGQAG
jgi:hypothetical protein